MKYAAIVLLLSAPGANAQPAIAQPAPDKRICVRADRGTDYNARAIGQHDILVQNAVGDRRPLRLSTTCIHLYPDSLVSLHSQFRCVAMGDDVAARRLGDRQETCRVSHVAPLIEGSIAAPYK